MKKILAAALFSACLFVAHNAMAASAEAAKEAVSESAKAADSAVQSKTAGNAVERTYHKYKTRYHKKKAKAAAKRAVQ